MTEEEKRAEQELLAEKVLEKLEEYFWTDESGQKLFHEFAAQHADLFDEGF